MVFAVFEYAKLVICICMPCAYAKNAMVKCDFSILSVPFVRTRMCSKCQNQDLAASRSMFSCCTLEDSRQDKTGMCGALVRKQTPEAISRGANALRGCPHILLGRSALLPWQTVCTPMSKMKRGLIERGFFASCWLSPTIVISVTGCVQGGDQCLH